MPVGLKAQGHPIHAGTPWKARSSRRCCAPTRCLHSYSAIRNRQFHLLFPPIGPSPATVYGQRAADFDFPIAEMLRNHPDTLAQYGMLGFFDNDTRQAAHKKAAAWLAAHKADTAARYRVKDWQVLFDSKSIEHWKAEGQVTIEDGLLKIGGDKGGAIVTTASYARGSLAFVYRQAGDARTTMTWRGNEHAFSPARQGWTSSGYDPAGKGESPVRIVAPPGTTIWLREFAFRPY